jgi:uncharacterized protein involved in exopolysaccharide biosynthesis
MLPGKTYTAEDVVHIALRRKWWIVVPFVLGTIVAIVVGKGMPLHYKSDTLIMLMPQRVAGGYVKSASGAPLEERLSALTQQILSRSRLEQIISTFDLYAAERATLPIEEVVRRMRVEDIQLKFESRESFRLSYVGLDSKTTQQVTEQLASLFIEKDVRDRENLTEDTNHFLDSELEDAKRRLVEYEGKMSDYRRFVAQPAAVVGRLACGPSERAGQLRMLREAVSRDRNVVCFERQPPTPPVRRFDCVRAAAERRRAALLPTRSPASSSRRPSSARCRRGSSLVIRYPPQERTIRELEAELETENANADPATAVADTPRSAASEIVRQRRSRELKAQLDEIDRQLAAKQEQDRQLRQVIAEHQANLDAVPRRESELVELTRDYGTLQGTYASLLNRQQEFRISASLERRSLGDQFKVVEPARESERPVGPRRIKIYAMGCAMSLVLGLLLAGLLEYLDTSLRSKSDIEQVLKLPVLASVPLIRPIEN